MKPQTNARPEPPPPAPAPPEDSPVKGHEHDAIAGPVKRGGSLLPHEHEQEPDNPVDESSDESFPASDAPSWSPTPE